MSCEPAFYCFLPRKVGWLAKLSGSSSEELVKSRLQAAQSSLLPSRECNCDADDEETGLAGSSLSRSGSLPATLTQSFKGAGLTVKLGVEEVASDLVRVKPYVYATPDGQAVIVFSGCLTNLGELARRSGQAAGASPRASGGSMSPCFSNELNNAGAGLAGSSLERKSSIERSLDVGASTASIVLDLYLAQQAQREGGEVILLSELQGEFALVIYDNRSKSAFAARDPSGAEPLYYHISETGDLSFAGSRLSIPDGEQAHEWRELPPGHYISGRKPPKLHMFALTPQQLAARELEQEDELDDSAHAGRRRSLSVLGPDQELQLAAQLTSRTSLEQGAEPGLMPRRKSMGLDGDVFSLDDL